IAALDKIIHRALAKSPAERYGGAQAMLADLMALSSADWSSQAAPAVRSMTRLIVVPFRLHGENRRAMRRPILRARTVRRSVDEGYFNVPQFARDPWLDPLRGDAGFA